MIYRFDEFRIDTGRFELRRGDDIRQVEPLVFDLIRYLAANPNRVVTRDEIIEHVWHGRIVSDATVSGCVKSARRALDDSGEDQRRIRTVRGRGFHFLGEVTVDAEADKAPIGVGEPNPSVKPVAREVLTGSKPDRPVIALLPFTNQSAEFDEYFADGLSEDIITNLTRFRELHVIARGSTFEFKGQTANLPRLVSELGADFVVEGSVRRAAGRVRISARLIDAISGVHVWAERYDRDMEDIFAVQDEVTRTIAAALGVKVQDAALQRAMAKNPAELGAYDSVLRARRYTWNLNEAEHAEARDLLENAVAQDPNNADAHALLANVYLAEHRFDHNPRPDPVGRALTMARKAVELDPQNAYARCWLAIVHFFRHENDRYEEEARRALDLNPNDAEILADIGHFCAFMGQFERGLELSMRARRLNPLHPGWYHFSSVRYQIAKRDYAEAVADVERCGMPNFYWCYVFKAAALGHLGSPEAKDALARLNDLNPGLDIRAAFGKWNAEPSDMEHILDGLRKAGHEG